MKNETKYDIFADVKWQRNSYDILVAFILTILIVTSVCGNALVCLAFTLVKELRTTTNYFICSLALSDLIVGLVSTPVWLCWRMGIFPASFTSTVMGLTVNSVDMIGGVSSIGNLSAISIDRYFGIVYPLKHRCGMTKKKALVGVICAWVYGIGFAVVFWVHALPISYFPVYTIIVAWGMPLIVMTTAYSIIFHTIRQSFLQASTLVKKEWKIAKTLILVTCLFALSWLPFFIYMILLHHCTQCQDFFQGHSYILTITKVLHFGNSSINPLVYAIFNKQFRSAFKKVLCCNILERQNSRFNHQSDSKISSDLAVVSTAKL